MTTKSKKFAIKTGSAESRNNTVNAIIDREPFVTSGSLHGRAESIGTGRLNPEELKQFVAAERARLIDYVVYSYSTPIAWHIKGPDDGVWAVSEQKHSVTTGTHQSVLRRALALRDRGERA